MRGSLLSNAGSGLSEALSRYEAGRRVAQRHRCPSISGVREENGLLTSPCFFCTALARFNMVKLGHDIQDVEGDLDNLLREFGPPEDVSSYPFDHLASDGVSGRQQRRRARSPGDARGRLRSTNARGRLDSDFEAALKSDPPFSPEPFESFSMRTLNRACNRTLLDQLGLDLIPSDIAESSIPGTQDVIPSSGTRSSSPTSTAAPCVASIRRSTTCPWRSTPHMFVGGLQGDQTSFANGICLCSLHHKLFDRESWGSINRTGSSYQISFRGSSTFALQMVLNLVVRTFGRPNRRKPLWTLITSHGTVKKSSEDRLALQRPKRSWDLAAPSRMEVRLSLLCPEARIDSRLRPSGPCSLTF